MKIVLRIVGMLALIVGGVAALALAFAAFVLFTGAGARLTLHIANGRDIPVHARSISGTFFNHFTLVGVEVQTPTMTATIDTVKVAWRPMALRARTLRITDLVVAGAHVQITADTTVADTMRVQTKDKLGAKWVIQADRLRVRHSNLDAPGDVHVHDIELAGDGGPDGYRATVTASGSAPRLDNARAFVRVAGNTTAATADSFEVRALDGVTHGSAFVRWSPGLSWRAHVTGDSLRVGRLMDTKEDWAGAIAFRARGTGLIHDDTLRVRGDLASLDGTLRGKPVFARGRVEIDGRRIAASDATVRWGSASATLTGRMAETANVRLVATIPSLAELLPEARGSARVRGRIDGTPEAIRVQVSANATQLRARKWTFPDLDATVDATLAAQDYKPHAVDVRKADVRVAEGTLSAAGNASWRDAMEWNARVDMQHVETSLITPPQWELRGPVSMRATTNGVRKGKSLRGELALESLSGTLRERALDGAGHVAVRNNEADFSDFHVTWGDAHLKADGHAGRQLDLDWDVAATDLSMLMPSWHGAVSVKGHARGPMRKPAVKATLSADSLRVLEYAARHIEGHVDFDPAFKDPVDIDVLVVSAVRGTGAKATVIDSIRVSAEGRRDDHRVSLAAVQGKSFADLTLRGAYADTSWTGVIENLKLRYANTATWETSRPAPLYVSPSRASLDSLTLTSSTGRIAANGAWQKKGAVRANAAVSGLALATLQKYMAGTSITGTVDGTIAFAMKPGAGVDAHVDLTAGPGEIVYAQNRVAYQGHVVGNAGKEGVSADVTADVTNGGAPVADLDGRVAIDGFVIGRDSLGSQPITGQLDLECKDIGPVMAVFAPAFAKSSGAFSAHVKPNGTARSFYLVGDAALANARLDTPAGLRLRKTNAKLHWDGEGRITMEGEATSGGGRMEVAANSSRGEGGVLSGSFTAKGERFQIMSRPDASVFVSPDLQVKLANRIADITGTVKVPYARIEVAQVPASAASASPDVIIVQDTLTTRPPIQARTQVRVALGDSVTFTGFGLRSRLAGSLQVDDERGRPTRGTGEIQLVDGKYRAFGSELKIDPGRLIFGGGPIDNPGIDLRAYKGLTTQNVMAASSGEIVGVNLRGSLRKPELTLFSNPPMSQNEMMSYLLFGRPSTTSSGGDQSALAAAAMLLSMQKGTQYAGDIGKKFSLDEAYLETGEEAGETALVAGKYLSPKLYVSYAAGLFEHTNTFRTRYSLTGHWTLQTESGKDDSTDLLYWFEHGK